MSSWLKSVRQYSKALIFAAMAIMVGLSVAAVPNNATWTMAGQSRTNWRYQPFE